MQTILGAGGNIGPERARHFFDSSKFDKRFPDFIITPPQQAIDAIV